MYISMYFIIIENEKKILNINIGIQGFGEKEREDKKDVH